MVGLKKVVYFGNKQSGNNSISVMETLTPIWANFCIVNSYSDYQNKFLKSLVFLFKFFQKGLGADKIVIDVYSTTAFYFAFFIGLFSKIFNKKYILILHGGNLPAREKKSPWLTDFLFKNAFKIVAPSFYLKNHFENKYEVIHIPNAIAHEKYDFVERSSIRPKILSIRGFGKPYNPLMAIYAIELILEEFPNINLTMLANENEFFFSSVIEYINKKDLGRNVTVLPKMPQNVWVDFSRNFDIMVSTPVIDNTPISIIEGMALGMCIVSTDVGGISQLLRHEYNGILVESNNFRELANAFVRILNDTELSRCLSVNARHTSQNYKLDDVSAKWRELLLND